MSATVSPGAGAGAAPPQPAAPAAEAERRATPLELFFDLVFVFALTQVTALMATSPTAAGLARGMLVLAVLWWAWAGYAWLTNTVDTGEARVRLTLFAAMAAMLFVALAAPAAFGGDALLFALAYIGVRVAHLVLYAQAGRGDPALSRAVGQLAISTAVAGALLVIASFLDGVVQGAVWALAILIDYGGPALGRGRGWRVHPGHFAERFGLIMIIALGESIVAIGVGAEDLALDAGVLVAGALAVAVACGMWWAYFDVVAVAAERVFRRATGVAQILIARDSYAYLHLPMVAGIVLFAMGVKKVLGHVDDALDPVPAIALCGGVAVYLLAHVAFRWRNLRTVNRQRCVAAAVLLALIPAALALPAIVSLGLVALTVVTLIVYEALRFAEARRRLLGAEAA